MRALLLFLALALPAAGQLVRPAIAQTAVNLACGGDLQTAINNASGPTTITIAHLQSDGVTRCNWSAGYQLVWRNDAAVVTIQTDGVVPPFGTRTQPGDSYLALVTANSLALGLYASFFPAVSGITATAGHPVHGYRFIGLEMVTPDDNHPSYGILGPSTYNTTLQTLTLADYPYQFDVEHCYIHGLDAGSDIARGISYSGNDLIVRDTNVSEIHSLTTGIGAESQAIWGCPPIGNWRIENNDLQASSETFFMCGGAEQNLNFYSPDGFNIRFNYIHKPPAWEGRPYTFKNLLEFKGATGALIDQNLFEYSWDQTQGGFAILMTPRLDRQYPYPNVPYINHTVARITITNNTIRHARSCFSLSLYDDQYALEGATFLQSLYAGGGSNHITVQNNLCDDISGTTWGSGNGTDSFGFFMATANVAGGTQNYNPHTLIDHNTINAGASPGVNSLSYMNNYDATVVGCSGGYTGPASDFVFTNNYTPWPTGRACATGPTAFPGTTSFTATVNHNTFLSEYSGQAAWDAAFPGMANLVNTSSNPDGRGANITQLSTLEPLIRAGTRPPGQ